MTTYNKDNVVSFSEKATNQLVKYMQDTNQGQILLRRDNCMYYITLYDGAFNQYQEPGYHDHITVIALPMMITLPELED